MIKESRLIVRLVSLWVIFVATLVLTFLSLGHLTMSSMRMINGGYETSYGYFNYTGSSTMCLQSPSYPDLQSSNEMMDIKDKEAMEKYNLEMEQYNKDYVEACKKDVQIQEAIQHKQEHSQRKVDRSMGVGDIAKYSTLTLLGLIALALSLREIKKTEQSQ